uniref:Uncharacterized protein n=1 Tax=Mycena chlorophos TaxID=658473 RepID=A0ABQ0LT48_MYCCL|nr:predicted protein [Mycena chlorophos]
MTSVHRNSKFADIPEYPISATDAVLTQILPKPRGGRMALDGLLSVFPSPLSDQTYRIWMRTGMIPVRRYSESAPRRNGRPRSPEEVTLRGISLAYSPRLGTGTLEPLLTGPPQHSGTGPKRVSFSGHGYNVIGIAHSGGTIGKLELENEGIDLEGFDYTHISSNSGNLVHIGQTTIGSVYFE